MVYGTVRIPETPSFLRTQGTGKREGLQCGVGDSENPRDSLIARDSGDGKERGTVRIPASPSVLGTQGMGKTEGLQCGVGDSENPRDSLSPWESGDGKDRGTAVWCGGQ